MTIRKRKNPTPHFGLPPPYSPVTGQEAPLSSRGVYPYVAMMQVAKTDVHQNYVICRGHDVRFSKFYDYAAGDPNKPGIAVAKPYGRRRPCLYRVGQIFAAIIPLQTPNPQPSTVPWRVGSNPGVSTITDGHPADLSETVTELYTDDGLLIDYMFLEGDNQQDLIVRAVGCILPGEGGTVRAQQWNSSTQCWEDDSYDPFTIIDPMGWLLAVDGDCFKVEAHDGGCGESLGGDYMPAFPFGMTQLVRVMDKIDCGACGEVIIVRKSETTTEAHCSTEATTCAFQACNMSYRPISCDGQEYAIAHIIPGQCCLPVVDDSGGTVERCIAFLMPYPRPMFGKGKLAQDMCGSAATLTESSWMDVCPAGTFTAPTAAGNTAKLHACADTEVLYAFTLNESGDCAAELVAVEDYELPEWVVDLKCSDGESDCSIEKGVKDKPRYGHFCNCTDEGPDVWDATQLTVERKTFVTSIEAGEPGEATDFLTGVECDGTCTISFATTGLVPTGLTIKQKSYCMICHKEQDEEDAVGPTVLALGTAGTPKTLVGVEQDVITGLVLKSEVTSEGGGDEEDCDTATIEMKLILTGTTTKICSFCPSGEGGTLEAGADVKLDGFKLSSVTALTDAELDCTGCPSLNIQGTGFWAFCVGDESEPVEAGACECDPCVEESA